jgi:hypothetical protein
MPIDNGGYAASVKARLRLDTDRAKEEMRVAGRRAGEIFSREFTKAANLKLSTDIDKISARLAGKKAKAIIEGEGPAKIKVGVDSAELGRLTRDVDKSSKSIGKSLSGIFGGKGSSKDFSFAKFGLSASGAMTALKVGAVGLSPVLVSIAGDAVYASTSLAAIGPAAISGLQGMHIAQSAFGGVLDAYKAYQATLEPPKGSSPEEKLQFRLKGMSKEGRDFFKVLKGLSERNDAFKRSMERAVLPGVGKLVKALSYKPKHGQSLLDIYEVSSSRVGKIIGKTAENIGKEFKKPEFRNAFKSILGEGEKSFTNLGHAATKVAVPIVRIFKGSAPLVTRFTKYIDILATKFSAWFGKFSDKQIANFFKGSGDRLSRWWKIAENIFVTVKNILDVATPSGGNLVDRIGDFTEKIKNFTSSAEGQKQIKNFFDRVTGFVTNFNYGKFANTVGDVGKLAIIFKGFQVVGDVSKHPLLAILGGIAANIPPAETAAIIGGIADAVTPLIDFAAKNPKAVGDMILFFGAVKGLSALSGLKLPKVGSLLGGSGKGSSGGGGPITIVSKNLEPNNATNPIWVAISEIDKDPMNVRVLAGPGGGGLGVAVNTIAPGIIAAFASAFGIKPAVKDKLDPRERVDSRGHRIGGYDVSKTRNYNFPVPVPVHAGTKTYPTPNIQNGKYISGGGYDINPATGQPFTYGNSTGGATQNPQSAASKGGGFKGFVGGLRDAIVPKWLQPLLGVPSGEAPSGVGARGVPVPEVPIPVAALSAYGKLPALIQAGQTALGSLSGTLQSTGRVFTDQAGNVLGYSTTVSGIPGQANTVIGTPGYDTAHTNLLNIYDAAGNVVGTYAATVTTPGADPAHTALSELRAKALLVDGKYVASISTDGYADVQSQLQGLLDKQWSLEHPGVKASTPGASQKQGKKARARGGPVWGAGSKTSDSIDAKLSNGEFVQQAAAVDEYGVPFMHALNQRRIPKTLVRAMGFANGGEVGDVSMPFKANVSKTKIPALKLLTGLLGGLTGAGGFQWQLGVLRAAGFDFHPSIGQTTGGGHAPGSWHYKGRAVDLSPPSMGVFNWIKRQYGATTKELIYGPAVVGIKNGQPHNFGAALNAEHMNHVHWAYKRGGLVNLPKSIRARLNREQENAVRKVASGKSLTARELEILRGMDAGDVAATYQGLGRTAFGRVSAKFSAGEKMALETFQTARSVRGIPGLSRSEEAAIVDAVNGGTLSAADRSLVSRLSTNDMAYLAKRLPRGSLNRLRPFLDVQQQAALDTTEGQRNQYGSIRSKLSGATRKAVANSAAGKRLSQSERALLAGMSSSQIAAYRDSLSDREWRNLTHDLSASQRRDTNTVLAGDLKERSSAISKARLAGPTQAEIDKTVAGLTRLDDMTIAKMVQSFSRTSITNNLSLSDAASKLDTYNGQFSGVAGM